MRTSRPAGRWYRRRVRALITGISGFVGRHLARELTEAGYEVHGFDRQLPTTPLVAAEAIHGGDILDGGSLRDLVATVSPDVLVHLAGAASVSQSFEDPRGTWRLNVDGTLHVLEAVRRAPLDVRTLVVTSSEVYGFVPEAILPVTEETPMRPYSPYGASKAAADFAAAQYHLGFGLSVLRVRPFNHLGPGQDNRFLVPSVAEQIARGEAAGRPRIEVRVGNTESRRDFLDVRDVVRAYRMILTDGDPNTPYVVGSGRSVSVQEILDAMVDFARVPVEVVSDVGRRRQGEQPDLYGSPERLAADTGWSPRYSLNETLRDTLDYWRARVAEEA